jgi:pyruvate/2-oxoglutarate dehydrogenase complex dihydrolipoamide dehydrogenase (E3) component
MSAAANARRRRSAGIALGEKVEIKVNDWLQTGTEGVWVAGDCVESFNLDMPHVFVPL